MGEPAVEALDTILRTAPKWRDKVGAAATLVTMGRSRTGPFAHVDYVQRALAIHDADGAEPDKRAPLEALLAELRQFDPKKEAVEWCKCGYPASRVKKNETREQMTDMLGFERNASNVATYYCPSCDARRASAN